MLAYVYSPSLALLSRRLLRMTLYLRFGSNSLSGDAMISMEYVTVVAMRNLWLVCHLY